MARILQELNDEEIDTLYELAINHTCCYVGDTLMEKLANAADRKVDFAKWMDKRARAEQVARDKQEAFDRKLAELGGGDL